MLAQMVAKTSWLPHPDTVKAFVCLAQPIGLGKSDDTNLRAFGPNDYESNMR